MNMNATIQQQPATWPEGVIARYLTVGGASVDIRETGPRDSSFLEETVATCIGCGDAERVDWRGHTADYRKRISRTETVEQSESTARAWAQEHAERCRAMPKPNGV